VIRLGKQNIVLALFFAFLLVLIYLIFFSLQHGNALIYWKILGFSLFLFLIPLVATFYYALPTWTISLLASLFSALTFLSFWATGSHLFLIPLIPYIVISIGFYYLNKQMMEKLVTYELELEKNLTDQNEIQHNFEERLQKSRSLQNKYLNYYNLRKGIEDLATHLSVHKLSELIVAEAYEFLKKGDRALLLLGDADASNLHVVASRSLDSDDRRSGGDGDYFDNWVLKNRQPLLISDMEKDFRFSIELKDLREPYQSTIIAPLLLESSGGGVIRINSSKKNAFTVEDMRLLQILSGLASTALLNSYLYSKTEELAIRDSLTGLYVHRYFKERLDEECRRMGSKQGQLFSLILMDLDYFKKFNDTFGHTSGDIALHKIARLMQEEFEGTGLVARYGGEEFGVILYECDYSEAMKRAERLRKRIADYPIQIRDQEHRFSISCGVAVFSQTTQTVDGLIQAADKALYAAKKKGRNQVC